MVTTSRSKNRRTKYTLLLDEEDGLALGELALETRRRTGYPVEKAEIPRALIRLASDRPAVKSALATALDRRPHDE